jgi:predicted DNA repair protein MutK
VIGTAAMLWVGGHIILAGFDELGWAWPYHLVHELEDAVDGVPAIGGVLAWILNTLASAIVGFVIGVVIALVVDRLPRRGAKRATTIDHAEGS